MANNPGRGAREINVWIDGKVVATCLDEIDARYEGQHLYSLGRAGGYKPTVGYTARYVMPFNAQGVQEVVELPLGGSAEVAQAAKFAAAQTAFDKATQAAADATAKAAAAGDASVHTGRI
jgi:hypothetical protein